MTRYWDVFPKFIRMTLPRDPNNLLPVPIAIRGTPAGEPVFEVSNPEVAKVDEAGNVYPSEGVGSTTIMVYDSKVRTSVRHVQVQVLKTPA